MGKQKNQQNHGKRLELWKVKLEANAPKGKTNWNTEARRTKILNKKPA